MSRTAPATDAGSPAANPSALWSLPAVAAVTLVFAALHLWAAANLHPYQDEAYYWWWAQYPAIGYYDHPPMVAWWIALGTAVFGDGPVGLRSVFILATVLGTAAIYATGRVLFDPVIAARAAIWSNATLLIGVGGMFATPDGPATLFWTLAVLALALVTKSGRGAWWLAVGLFAGLGLLAKYNVFFLGLGIVLCLLVDRDLRRWFSSPWLWLGGLVALVVFMPVIVWNYQNDWASFAKQFGRVVRGELTLRYLGDYVGGVVGLLNPLIAVFAGLGAWMWIRRRLETERRPTRLLIFSTLPLLAYFAIHALHARVEGNWVAPVYPTLALVAAVAADRVGGSRAWRVTANAVLPLGLVLSLIGTFVVVSPGGWQPPGIHAARMFQGWPAFTADVEALRTANDATWIATDDYNIAAELAYGQRGRNVPVEQITERIRYGFAPTPNEALTSTRGLLLVREDRIERYNECLDNLTPVGTVDRVSRDGDIRQHLTAYTFDGVSATLFTAGCDGNP